VGLLTGLLGLPFAPLRATVWIAEQVGEEAERRLSDPGLIRRQLEEVAEARRTGAMSDEEATRAERELVSRLMTRGNPRGRVDRG
jgi:hypothetical protein